MEPDVATGERVLMAALNDPTCKFIQTGSPNVICTLLPEHWRINKTLPTAFQVIALGVVADGTVVRLAASNKENLCGELVNSTSVMRDQIARFTNLRFVSRSGRGKSFNVVITICSQPPQIAVYPNAIKVTADGPREARVKLNVSASKNGGKRSQPRQLGYRRQNSDDSSNPVDSSDVSVNGSTSVSSNSPTIQPTSPPERRRKYHRNEYRKIVPDHETSPPLCRRCHGNSDSSSENWDINTFQSPFEHEDLSSSNGDVIPADRPPNVDCRLRRTTSSAERRDAGDFVSGDRRRAVNDLSPSSADYTRLRQPDLATTVSAACDEYHLHSAIPFTPMKPTISSFHTTPTMTIPERNEFALGRRSLSSPKLKADDAGASFRLTSFPNVGSGRRFTADETAGESMFAFSLLSTDLLLTVATYMSPAVSSGRGVQQSLTFEKVKDKDPERCRSMTSQYDQYKQRTKTV